jgi:hypothetical protein
VPTDDQRALVEQASAFGVTQASIAAKLKISEPTLRLHFRDELDSGKFKTDILAGKTIREMMKSKDERVRLDAAKYYTARRMGWKETIVAENVGKDGGPIETEFRDVSERELFESRIARLSDRRAEKSHLNGDDPTAH